MTRRYTLWRPRKYSLKLNVGKTIIGTSEVQYFGYTLTAKGVECLSKDHMKAVKDLQPPMNMKQIREFVTLANYFQFLILEFWRLAGPLTKLTTRTDLRQEGQLPEAALK